MGNVLKMVLTILFDSSNPVLIVLKLLYIVGLWKLLLKSGLKGWLALIPWVREYQIARCAMREPEGRIYCLINFVITVFNSLLAMGQMDESSSLASIASVLLSGAVLVELVYAIRIYSGLCEIYGKKKLWILPWLFSGRSIARRKVRRLRWKRGSAGIRMSGSLYLAPDRQQWQRQLRSGKETIRQKLLFSAGKTSTHIQDR